MKTYLAKTGEIKREALLFDASEAPVGRLAVRIANALRGKDRPTYTPHIDTGAFVIVINADKALLTGKKLDQKYYRTHSGYAGGLHETKYRDLMAKRPEFAFQLAVKGMLGKNKLRAPQLKRLKVYAGGEHKHAAQKPEVWA